MKNVTVATLLALSLFSCGKDDDDDKTTGPSAQFTSTINPILQDSCGTANCHASGGASIHLVGNETNTKAYADSIISRVCTQQDMPNSEATTAQSNAFSRADAQTLRDFVKPGDTTACD